MTTNFTAFPAMGYWEIDGQPVSSEEAQAGLHPRAVWRETEIAKQLTATCANGHTLGATFDGTLCWKCDDCGEVFYGSFEKHAQQKEAKE